MRYHRPFILTSTILSALFLFGCQGGDPLDKGLDDLQPGDVVATQLVLPSSDVLNFSLRGIFEEVEVDANAEGGFLNPIAWDTAKSGLIGLFDDALSKIVGDPLEILEDIAFDGDAVFVVQDDGTLVLETIVEIDGQIVEILAEVTINDDGSILVDVFADGIQRLAFATNADFTDVNTTVFDENGVPAISVDFFKNGDDFSLVFADLQTGDVFSVVLAANVLTVEADLGGDGFGNVDGEFQVIVNLDDFTGQVSFVQAGEVIEITF